MTRTDEARGLKMDQGELVRKTGPAFKPGIWSWARLVRLGLQCRVLLIVRENDKWSCFGIALTASPAPPETESAALILNNSNLLGQVRTTSPELKGEV